MAHARMCEREDAEMLQYQRLLKKLKGRKLSNGYYKANVYYIRQLRDGRWRVRSGGTMMWSFHGTLSDALRYVDSKVS